jgi:hypothetical protein
MDARTRRNCYPGRITPDRRSVPGVAYAVIKCVAGEVGYFLAEIYARPRTAVVSVERMTVEPHCTLIVRIRPAVAGVVGEGLVEIPAARVGLVCYPGARCPGETCLFEDAPPANAAGGMARVALLRLRAAAADVPAASGSAAALGVLS